MKHEFRAWDKNTNQWIEIFGDVFLDEEGEVWIIEERNWAYQTYMHKENITDHVIIVRYTGLKDKNGKEIYEGDIVYFTVFDFNGSDTQYRGVIKFAECMFQIWESAESEYYGPDGAFEFYWVYQQDDEIEVIGNIYEDEHLIKKAE